MKASSNVFSQEGFARSILSGSMRTNSIPGGFEKYILDGSGGCNCAAFIMNSVQMGSADRAPSRLRSRLSSYPYDSEKVFRIACKPSIARGAGLAGRRPDRDHH